MRTRPCPPSPSPAGRGLAGVITLDVPEPHYSITIEWCEEDLAYVVILPEWAELYAMPVASGKTYQDI